MSDTNKERWDARFYSKHSLPQKCHALDLLDCYRFRGDEAILDIGCGDGKITSHVSGLVPEGNVLGIDNSSVMIKHATDEYGCNNLQFSCQDAVSFVSDNQFDLVLSFSCIHWIKEQQSLFDNIYNLLKPGGRLIALTYPDCFYWDLLQETCDSPEWCAFFNDYELPYHLLNPKETRSMLVKSGLVPLRIDQLEKRDFYTSAEEYKNFVRGWLPHLQRLPEDKRAGFLDTFVDKYFSQIHIDDGGVVHSPFIRLDIDAIRL